MTSLRCTHRPWGYEASLCNTQWFNEFHNQTLVYGHWASESCKRGDWWRASQTHPLSLRFKSIQTADLIDSGPSILTSPAADTAPLDIPAEPYTDAIDNLRQSCLALLNHTSDPDWITFETLKVMPSRVRSTTDKSETKRTRPRIDNELPRDVIPWTDNSPTLWRRTSDSTLRLLPSRTKAAVERLLPSASTESHLTMVCCQRVLNGKRAVKSSKWSHWDRATKIPSSSIFRLISWPRKKNFTATQFKRNYILQQVLSPEMPGPYLLDRPIVSRQAFLFSQRLLHRKIEIAGRFSLTLKPKICRNRRKDNNRIGKPMWHQSQSL